MTHPDKAVTKEPEHQTDGLACWCNPTLEQQPNGAFVIIHKHLGKNEDAKTN